MSSNKLVKFNNYFRDFVQTIDPVLGMLGILTFQVFAGLNNSFGAGFFVLLVIVQFAARPTKKIRYSFRSFSIKYHDALEIKKKIDDKSIAQLTLTGIAIWNAGTEKFTDNDINNNPLIIELANREEIIAVDVLDQPKKNNSTINRFNYDDKKEASKVHISFNNLAPNEGASIQIIHTGDTNSTINVVDSNGENNLNGFDIKKVNYSQSRASLSFNQRSKIAKIALGSAFFATLVSFLLVYRLYWDWEQAGNWLYWVRIIGFSLYTFFGNLTFILFSAEWFVYGRRERIPKEFDNFHNQASQ
ncbi:MAG: hypothetical protein KA716_19160 [Gloeotrichia echinulata DEX184]|jgi:hypothetical protein|nr:hypothetical protein [Gloeotrichia echinulata DEX184]